MFRTYLHKKTQLLRGAQLLAAFVLAGHGATALAMSEPAGAGEITLAVGRAVVVGADGQMRTAARGGRIHPGDRIETGEGGHVHVRFVDDALVAVRPTSRLVVEAYQYNPAHVAQSLVRFRLEKGVARAISGAAAEGARERFRLNTPLVAIGVRGTDFVVRSHQAQTIAAVNQGAIVMAPFGEGCQPHSTGACGSRDARLLTAEMGNTLVEFRTDLAQPELRQFRGMRQTEAVASSGGAPLVRQNPHASVAEESVVAIASRNAVSNTAADKPGGPPGTLVPDLDLAPLPEAPAQLAWGRWGESLDTPDMATTRELARAGRAVTVGNRDYLLYRDESTASVLGPSLGTVGFALQSGQAHFTAADSSIQTAAVDGGSLTINFGARQFATALALSSAATGDVRLEAAGLLRDDGIFTARSSAQAVAGAVALDASSAGYFFEKAAAGGTLSGVTLWKQP